MASSRSINNALIRSLGRCENPVYVLDGERVIRYVNEALLNWLGADSELIGARCDYHSRGRDSEAEQAASHLCPPPEVFEGQQMTGSVARSSDDGPLVYRDAGFVPLSGEKSSTESVLVVVAANDSADANRDSNSHSDRIDPAVLHRQLQALRNQFAASYSIDRLIGDSTLMRRVRDQVGAAIASQARVVVMGPEGSGCEQVARTIFFGAHHQNDAALVPVDCRLTDAELLQATVTNLQTQIDTSDDVRLGTLLLLDADEMSGDAQRELLGFLSLPSVDFTIIATAHQSLFASAREGDFVLELAHALSTIEIELPPLVRRREDIPLLCQAALEDFNAGGDKQLSGFTEEALEQLAAYPWPGDVEQLIEFVGKACSSADGPLVAANDLPRAIRLGVEADELPEQKNEAVVLDDLLADIEAELLRRALARAKGNKTKAAQLLGISRARFHRRLEQLELTEDSDAAK